MKEKDYIPGTNPEWGRELPDGDLNSLVDKSGNSFDNGFNFDEKDDEPDYPEFDPEKAKELYDSEKDQ